MNEPIPEPRYLTLTDITGGLVVVIDPCSFCKAKVPTASISGFICGEPFVGHICLRCLDHHPDFKGQVPS